MSRKLYTVVNFLDGSEDTSEIPSNWLVGDDKCWWPPTRNVGPLIAKRVEPNKENWELYDIEITYQSDNLEAARKKADDLDYSTQDEVRGEKGRGKRKKRVKLVQINERSERSSSEEEREVVKEAVFGLPQFPDESNTDSPAVANSQQPETGTQSPELEDGPSHDAPCACNNNSKNQAGKNVELEFVNVSTDNLVTELRDYVAEQFVKVQRNIARLQLSVENLHSRSGNEKPLDENGGENLKVLKSLIPVDKIDNFKIFEERLLNEEMLRNALANYYQTLGGNTLKEKIVRIFKRTISNNVAAKASWYGQRQNFKMENTKTVSIIKDALSKSPDYNEKVFEEVASDWIRQGKQRLQRENTKGVQD